MGRNKPRTKKRGKIPSTSDQQRQREIKIVRSLLDDSSPILDPCFHDGSPNPKLAREWHQAQVKEYSKTSFRDGVKKESDSTFSQTGLVD